MLYNKPVLIYYWSCYHKQNVKPVLHQVPFVCLATSPLLCLSCNQSLCLLLFKMLSYGDWWKAFFYYIFLLHIILVFNIQWTWSCCFDLWTSLSARNKKRKIYREDIFQFQRYFLLPSIKFSDFVNCFASTKSSDQKGKNPLNPENHREN